jgi:hypothetical protein
MAPVSGHSDQQDAISDMGEEDGMDESAVLFPLDRSVSDAYSYSDYHK